MTAQLADRAVLLGRALALPVILLRARRGPGPRLLVIPDGVPGIAARRPDGARPAPAYGDDRGRPGVPGPP